MSRDDLNGRWALVTGASSGLGVDFARELAAKGCHLVLVARREERLREVAEELQEGHGVRAEVVAQDLSTSGAGQQLFDEVQRRGLEISFLVNNAGFGLYGSYLQIPWEREHTMLQLDIVTLAHLTKLFANDMAGRGFGRILQVASIGAYQATPTYAAYAAAKSFVLHFGEAVDYELAGTGVSCTVLSPGVTATEFLQVSGQKPTLYQRLLMMKSADVARIGVRAMLNGRRSIIPGFLNSVLAWSVRLVPRRTAAWIGHLVMREG